MMIGNTEIVAIWAAGSMAGSMLFWGTLLLGRLMSRMERVETRVDDAHKRMDSAGEHLSDLAGDVQKLIRKADLGH